MKMSKDQKKSIPILEKIEQNIQEKENQITQLNITISALEEKLDDQEQKQE